MVDRRVGLGEVFWQLLYIGFVSSKGKVIKTEN